MRKPIIDAEEALVDIRSGMDDAGLMEKYSVSIEGLQSLFRKLVDSGIMDLSEIEVRIGDQDGSLILDTDEPFATVVSKETETIPSPSVKTVLAVSDDPDFVARVEHLCREAGFTAITYENCLPDIEVLQEVHPDIFITDLNPSFPENEEFINITTFVHNYAPLIIAVEPGDRRTALRGLEAGAYGYLAKPLERELFSKAVAGAVEHGELVRFKREYEKLCQPELRDKTLALMVRTKDLLKGIIDSSTLVSVVFTDLDQNVRFWNKGAENIFGYTAEEMIGAKITRLYPGDALTRETVEQLRGLTKSKTETVHGKMKQIAKDGRLLTVSLALSPVVDAEGEVVGILGVGVDVTEQIRQNKEIVSLINQVKKTQDVAILTLAGLIESRGEEAGLHLTRLQKYCRVLCDALAERPAYKEVMNRRFVEDLVRSSVLHDIGKIATSETAPATDKSGRDVKDAEKRHPIVGGKALEAAVKRLGERSFLTVAMEIAYYHHENWDGSGYPFGLKEERIPLSARIVALADTYDILTNDGPAGKALSHEEACRIIEGGEGTAFDPDLVGAFKETASDLWAIRNTLHEW